MRDSAGMGTFVVTSVIVVNKMFLTLKTSHLLTKPYLS